MTFVIAICGTMGSGKSTAVENIAAALPDCQSLHEDDYNRTTERSLDEIKTWWDRGADVGEFDLSELIQQMAIRCPDELPSRKCQSPDLLKTDIATGQHQGTSQHQGTDVPRSPGITAPPTSGVGRGNPEILLLETHFGRLHPGLNPWIDFQCWIDVPADIAVARKIAQMSAQIQAHSSIEFFCL